MKNIIITIIILIFLMIAFITELNADDPCIPDCENSAWSSFQVIPIYLSSCGGTVFIKYRYRIACNIFYDYYIEEVRFSSAIRDCLDRIYGGDLNMIMQDITEALIVANPAGFPPIEPNKCETNWRVMMGSCWMPTIIPHVPMIENEKKGKSENLQTYIGYDVLIPCTINDCCLEYYTVCTDQYGNRTITQTGYLPPEDPECGGHYNELCVPVCGSIYNR